MRLKMSSELGRVSICLHRTQVAPVEESALSALSMSFQLFFKVAVAHALENNWSHHP